MSALPAEARASRRIGPLARSHVLRDTRKVKADTGASASQSNRYGVPVALGRTKIGRRQQASGANTVAEPEEPDQELESYLAALSPEEDMQTTGSGRAFGSSEVFQLRLPLMANERLKEVAAQQGLSPAALAKDWIMQHLSLDPEPAPNSNPAPNGGPAPDNHIGFPMSGPEDRYTAPPASDGPFPGGPVAGSPTDGQDLAWPQQEPPQYGAATQRARYGGPGDEQTDTEITVPGGSYY